LELKDRMDMITAGHRLIGRSRIGEKKLAKGKT